MPIVNGLALPNPLSNGTTGDAVQVMADLNYLLAALNRAMLDTGAGVVNAQSAKISNLANGVAGNDAVNLSQLGAYALLAGAAFTGGITGTTLGLSGALTGVGASFSSLAVSGAVNFSGTTNVGTLNASNDMTLTTAALIIGSNNRKISFADANGSTPFFICQSDNNFAFYGTDAAGSARSIWSVLMRSSTSGFNVVIPTTATSLVASGLITGNAGFSGTTLSLSSTLGVTGASTLAALTASGLITGNAGFSGTTLSLSGLATIFAGFANGQTNASNGAFPVGFSHRFTGQVGYHLYNGGATCEWGIYQPAHATDDHLHIAQVIAGVATDWMVFLSGGGVRIPGALTPGSAANSVGYLGIPSNVKTTNYALVASDIGQDITLNGASLTLTIPAGLPNGFACTITNINASNVTITSATDTLTLSGTTTTGNRTLGQNGEVGLRRKNGVFYASGTALS